MRERIEGVRRDLDDLAAHRYCADPVAIALDALDLLTPPEDISTTECAQRYRKIRTVEGAGHINWTLSLTPYLKGPQDALDDPNVQEVIIPKPGRTGGTVAFENHLFKRMRFGPMSDVGWYLGGPDEVKSYCDKQVTPMFEDHPEIAAKVGTGRSDNTIARKKVSGRFVEYLAASGKTITGRQFGYMIGDEIDTFPKRIRASFLQQARVRGRALGNKRKVGMTSHPDAGWTDGIAAAWIDSSRGIYVWPCAECGGWSSPWPTQHWPDVPRTELWYQKIADAGRDERIAKAMETAAMQCPHCGALLTDEQRKAMSIIGQWMHRGQSLDVHAGPMGTPDASPSMGFWIHGLMSMMVTNAELARDLEAATIVFERTRKTEQFREVLAKIFGQVFEGTGAAGMLDSAALIRRSRGAADGEEEGASPHIFSIGQCPPEVRFITMAVDVGAAKFDVSYYGWDEEGRSWWIDRLTNRQRMWADRILRDIRTRERIEDWDSLLPFIGRTFPVMGRPGFVMPVAQVVIDVSDGNVSWLGREFAARCWKAGMRWGKSWPIVQLIQGSPSATAPELPPKPRLEDSKGIKFPEGVKEWTLGVHRLKELALERLAVDDGGPGQCYFADGIASNYFEEFFGERLIEGKWVRQGPNESLDLFAYAEAARLMLKPDRKDINWNGKALPPWATPVFVGVEGGDLAVEGEVGKQEPPSRKQNIFERFDQLNKGR